ncbi:pancreatic triacylglycerol lipase-like [Anneissia japonica]|uniref:pancreatic triacylglycerol lipase-like n=1 Tax=Anneissia japonica TaxID=1529436 RepID=UPI00142592E0|nr:pancreatic triacylglycerol lipase-like [Anneissia japonica]
MIKIMTLKTLAIYVVLLSTIKYSNSRRHWFFGKSSVVCYDDIGCFDKGSPFYDMPDRPISYLPDTRDQVGTKFLLNTRQNPTHYQQLKTNDLSTITGSFFDPSLETKIMTHGFMESGNVWWLEDMMTEFLNNGNFNVIRVGWGPGARELYGQSSANTRIVGAEISYLLDKFKELYGYTADKVHVIGHSLGAHVAGYAGERQLNPKLGRITGMDPAGPYFEGMDIVVRLDPTDATFVDIIHTDTDPIYTFGYGIYVPVGHMDFYPNGGFEQTGCDQGLVSGLITEGGIYDAGVQYVACNHVRSYEYFTESINTKCPFRAYECTSKGYGKSGYEHFSRGECFDGSDGVRLGLDSIKHKPVGSTANVIYYLETVGKSSYCGYNFKFEVFVDDPGWIKSSTEKGSLYVTLMGYKDQSQRILLTKKSQDLKPGESYTFVAASDVDPGALSGVLFEWEYDPDWYKPWDWDVWTNPEIYVHQIIITNGEDSKSVVMCGAKEDKIKANEDVVALFPVTNCDNFI